MLDQKDRLEHFKASFFNDFHKRLDGWVPKNINQWWMKVDSSKNHVRKTLLNGEESVQKFYKLESQQDSLTEDQCLDFQNRIVSVLPEYFTRNKFTHSILAKPTMGEGSHNVLKVSKNIKTNGSTYLNDYFSGEEKLQKTRELDKILSQLGEAWAKRRSGEAELEITLSTIAKAFILLGHYGPDQDSCWRQGCTSPYDKYVVAQSNNTFVISISKKSEKTGKQRNVARCFGFLSDDGNCVNLCNYYFSPKFNEGDALCVIEKLLRDIFHKELTLDEGIIAISSMKMGDRDFHHNKYGNWSFRKSESPIKTQVLKLDGVGIISIFCPRCGDKRKDDAGWEDVDEVFVCHNCVSDAKVCELSNKKTFHDLVEIIDINGSPVMVCEEVADHQSRCEICDRKTSGRILTHDNKNVCYDCNELNYSPCDICENMVNDEEIIEVGGSSVCKNCKEIAEEEFKEELSEINE